MAITLDQVAHLLVPTDTRRNRRATTDGRPVRDNRIWEVRVLMDGVGRHRSDPLYYRRHMHDGTIYTGPATVEAVAAHRRAVTR